MGTLLETLPVALAVLLALTFAFLAGRSLLHMLFEALGRVVERHADAATD